MTDYRQIDRLRKDPRAFRALCAALLAGYGDDFNEWEIAFLESNSDRSSVEQFTTLQGEKLLEIRDGIETVESYRGFSIQSLISGCYEARQDLSEDDEAWITRLRERSSTTVRRREAGHLARCARQLCLIDEVAA